MDDTVVDKLHRDFKDVVGILENKAEVSLRTSIEEVVRKSLLLCAASYFERRLTAIVETFVREMSRGNSLVTSLVKNKAIHRQYHTWFVWEAKNANSFFGLFGDEFKKFMKARVESDRDLEMAIKAFLELGNERNRLTHQDFGSFLLEKTADEIYILYQQAMKFVDMLPSVLRECSAEENCD